MLKFFLFIFGFFLSTIGLFFIILYLNLLTLGYSFFEFVYFIIRSFYCDLFFIGLLLIYFSLEGCERFELLLRRFSKFSR